MSTLRPREALLALRPWTARSAEHLAAAATLLLERLGLEPAPETTAVPRLTARTVHYYVSQGLLSPPEGHTRRAVYHYRHLLELLWIKAAQARGQTLDDIRRELHGAEGTGGGEGASTGGHQLAGLETDDLEAALLRRLPDPAALPLPASPVELDRAVSRRLGRPVDRTLYKPLQDVADERRAVDDPTASHPGVSLGALSTEPGDAARQADVGVRFLADAFPALESPSDFMKVSELDPPVFHSPPVRPSHVLSRESPVRASLQKSRRVGPDASLQIQVHLGQGIRLYIPADHPLAEAVLDRGLTVADLYRLLHMDEPPARDDQRRRGGDQRSQGEEEQP